MPDSDGYEVYALRYASRATHAAAEFFRYELYGEPDEPLGLDYFFWLVRDGTSTILVDCGFDRDRSARKGRYQDIDPVELLARLDVRPADVGHILLTHLHYDHCGNVGLFPNATVSVARAELEAWSGSLGERDLMRWVVEPAEVRAVTELREQGRLRLVESACEVLPGITMSCVGGHTPGQSIVQVRTAAGSVVLASDAMHYYAETERDRPYNLFTDLDALYRGYDLLRELQAQPDTTVVAGHDPLVTSRFAPVAAECFDLTAREGAT
jgi:glyoxylase-like metal-dependent hydrolase (beta-lactamase superfamily II)